MKATTLSNVYDNPLPQLRSRQSQYPNICQLKDGTILCCHIIGEAMESVDARAYLTESKDGGRTWSESRRIFSEGAVPESESCKVTPLRDGRMMAFGYAFPRPDPELPLGNPATGGLLADRVFCAFSEDGGRTWGEKITVPDHWNGHTEASGPVVELQDGTLAAPITGFPGWDGKPVARNCGRYICSKDGGKTWNDDVVCMEFPGDTVTCYEQRLCQLDSGVIAVIGWNEDLVTGERLPNHITYSADGGKTFSAPVSSGIMGQASSVCALGGEKFMMVIARRRDTDRPGVYGYVVDFSDRTMNIVEEAILWEPDTPMKKDTKMAEIFSFLKFGQPSVIRLQDGSLGMIHWYKADGQYSCAYTHIEM